MLPLQPGTRQRPDHTDRTYQRWYTGEAVPADSIEASGRSEREFVCSVLDIIGFEPRIGENMAYDPEIEPQDRLDSYVLDPDEGSYRVKMAIDVGDYVEGIWIQETHLKEDITVEWDLRNLDDLFEYLRGRERLADQFAYVVEGEGLFEIEEYGAVEDMSTMWEAGLEGQT
jgi:hypothetical protein